MPSKFGLKDFVILLVLAVLALSLWLKMVQDDRRWQKLQGLQAQTDQIESLLARVQLTLDENAARPVVYAPSPNPAPPNGAPVTEPASPPAPDDNSWQLPGVPVTLSDPWDFSSDPTADPDFAPGGSFTEMMEGQPPKLTPYIYADVYARRINDLVTESLGWFDPRTLALRGRLAQAWQYDPEGMWVRVKINDRARFSNGDPVLADDVAFTYHNVMFNNEVEAERFRQTWNAMDRVEVVGDPATSRVVHIHFKESRFDNLAQAFTFKILPRSVYEPWLESPTRFNASTGLLVGSGPFKLRTVDPDDQWAPPADVVLVRNELYWGPRAPLAEHRVKVIQDRVALLTAYTNGEGDMMRATYEQYENRSQDDSFLAHHNLLDWFNMQGGYSFIAWQCGPRNGKLTPFHDRRVRLAMTHVIDRDRIRQDIEEGLTRVATGPFLSSTPQADPTISPWPVDHDRARALLAEAGWIDRDDDQILENQAGDEFEFEIKFGQGSQGTLRMCEFVRTECAKVGVRVVLTPIDWSTLQSVLNNRDFDAVTFAWSASAPESDPNQIWHSGSIANQGDNFIQWNSPEADALIEEGRRVLNDAERMQVWHRLHRVFHEEQPYTFLSEMPWLRFVTKRARNVVPYASGLENNEFWVVGESQPMQN